MAKCKSCKTNIPDGKEYCNDCLEKEKSKEAYLDSLLNSVKNTTPAAGSVYTKKRDNNVTENPVLIEKSVTKPKKEEVDPYEIDLDDIEDFDQFDVSDDLDLDTLQTDIVISDEDLFGSNLDEIILEEAAEKETPEAVALNTLSLEDALSKLDKVKSFDHNGEEEIEDKSQLKDQDNIESIDNLQGEGYFVGEDQFKSADQIEDEDNLLKEFINGNDQLKADDQLKSIDKLNREGYSDIENYSSSEDFLKELSDDYNKPEPIPEFSVSDNLNINDLVESNINPNEIRFFEDESEDAALDELLNGLDFVNNHYDESSVPSEVSLQPHDGINSVNLDEIEELNPGDEDFLNLLNQIDSDDPVAADVKAINDLLQGKEDPSGTKPKTPSDVGDVFSDALKAVSSLDDPEMEALNASLSKQVKEIKGKKKGKGKEDKDTSKKEKKKNKKKADIKEEEKGKSLFQKLFGNVPDEKAKKKAESKKATDEESADARDTNARNSKPVKGKRSNAIDEDTSENGKSAKDKKATKKEAKKEKKEKKKKDKEVIQVIDEIDEDTGRINRAGASIVFIFFGILVTLLLIGTNVFSYSLSIQNATNYFNRHKYTQAYNEVYGKDIKDEDIEIYDKIMTVMFVNKQLNSYNNNYAMKKYPEALDSLLKGLKRYDKYIELATMLGIKSDLDYVRTQILTELKNVFHLSEADALKLIKLEDKTQYSIMVYNVVQDNMNN